MSEQRRPRLNPSERKLMADMADSGQPLKRLGTDKWMTNRAVVSAELFQAVHDKMLVYNVGGTCYALTELGLYVGRRAAKNRAKR